MSYVFWQSCVSTFHSDIPFSSALARRTYAKKIKSSVLFSCYLPSNELLKLHQNLEAMITLSDAQNIGRFPVQNWTASDGELNWTGVIVDRVQIDI